MWTFHCITSVILMWKFLNCITLVPLYSFNISYTKVFMFFQNFYTGSSFSGFCTGLKSVLINNDHFSYKDIHVQIYCVSKKFTHQFLFLLYSLTFYLRFFNRSCIVSLPFFYYFEGSDSLYILCLLFRLYVDELTVLLMCLLFHKPLYYFL